MQTILLIDDDERLGTLLAEYFLRYGLTLISEIHPQLGLQRLQREAVDLVILDIMLPDMDGFEVCRIIRKTSEVPILMLTARGEVMDRIIGLELGADDYLAKPFEARELVARIHNILKRLHSASSLNNVNNLNNMSDVNLLQFTDLSIDKDKRDVIVKQQRVELTAKEYALLLLFAESPHKTFSRDEMINALSGIDSELFSRSIDIAVSRLRHKLDPLDCIKTIWGAGYRFILAPV